MIQKITRRIRKRPGPFIVLGSAIIFLSFIAKDNISENIRLHMQSLELAQQVYSLHSDNIELGTQIRELADILKELKLEQTNNKASTDLENKAKGAADKINEAVTNAKMTFVSDESTGELIKHIGDSEWFFLWSEGKERIVRDSLKLSQDKLEELVVDIEESQNLLKKAYKTLDSNASFTPKQIDDAFGEAGSKSGRAMFQAITLKDMARENRNRAIKVAESYRDFLGHLDRICSWVIIGLAICGAMLGILSQLAGVGEAHGG